MTYKGKNISWFEYMSAKSGKTEEELREQMREMRKKSSGRGPGFDSERARAAQRKSTETKRLKKLNESKIKEQP